MFKTVYLTLHPYPEQQLHASQAFHFPHAEAVCIKLYWEHLNVYSVVPFILAFPKATMQK